MQLTAIPDPLPVPRGSAAAAAPVTAVTPTAALPVEAPTVLPDFGSSTNADTASQTAARVRRASGGTPVDAPARGIPSCEVKLCVMWGSLVMLALQII